MRSRLRETRDIAQRFVSLLVTQVHAEGGAFDPFFPFFFQGTAFLPSAGVIILSYYFSSANFVAPFHAAGRIPASLLCPSGWIRGEDRPIMPRNASRFVNVGMKGSLKEPSGLVSRFLRGREDGAEIRNDFHFLYRANYVQRCFFLSFFHLRGKLLHDGTEDVWFQDRSRHKYL